MKQLIRPTIVDGVVQIRIPIETADYPLFPPATLRDLQKPASQVLADWVEYCSLKIITLPRVVGLPRYGTLVQKGVPSSSEFVEVSKFAETAELLGVISRDERQYIVERFDAKREPPEALVRLNARINAMFWGIHYIDYHLTFLDAAAAYGTVQPEQVATLKKQLLAADAATIDLPAIYALFSSAAGPNAYARTKRAIESIALSVAGHFILAYSKDTVLADLRAHGNDDRYLKPGFEQSAVEDWAWISGAALIAFNQPEILVEGLMSIASYQGELGRGDVIQTHTLFPGEKAVVSMQSYKKETSSYAITSSVLDNTSTEAELSLANEVNVSNAFSTEDSRTSSFSAGVDLKANWGWGSGGASANYSTTSTSTAKRAATNAVKAVRNQASKVSSNRTVKVDTTRTVTSETSTTSSLTRTIENINVSKPLTFIFRQLTVDILSIILIRDCRVVLRANISDPGLVCVLEQTPDVARERFFDPVNVTDAVIKKYYDLIVETAKALAYNDALGTGRQFVIDEAAIPDTVTPRKRVNNELDHTVPFPIVPAAPAAIAEFASTGAAIQYSGIALELTRNVLKTDGTLVECELSVTEGLDDYSRNLQLESIREKAVSNVMSEKKQESVDLALKLVQAAPQADQTAMFEKLVLPFFVTPKS
jgi:hypothetical protein